MSERLFRILGLIADDLIEEAGRSASRRRPWRNLAAAACVVLVCGATFGFLAASGGNLLSGGASGNTASDGASAGAGEHDGGTAFMSYAGPILPLTTAEANPGLLSERTITWDLSPGTYADGSPRQWGAAVSDCYALTNPSEEAITVTALYPFTGSFSALPSIQPGVTVNGAAAEPKLYAGPYAGGFRDAGEADDSTWNLARPSSWTDYQELLESGAYLDQALGEEPRLDVPVTVYSFSDFSLPEDAPDAATQAVTFTLDPERTTVLSYGFNGMSQEAGWRQYSYFVPNGVRSESDLKLLVIIGDDLGAYTLQGYVDGGCEQMLADVSCTVTRTETTFDAVLEEICRSYAAEYNARRSTEEATAFDFLSLDMLQRAAAELLTQYGLFSENAKDRYSDGRLDEIVSESLVQERVLYLAFPVTIPAGGSAAVSVALWKEPSYDFGCSGSENTDLQGYDLITCLGSTLNFTSQTAVLAETQGVELVRQNIGFDPEDGITQVPLDLTEEHYFIEIRPTP